jgi:hypothetical protein
MSFNNLLYSCFYLKTAIICLNYLPQFYLNWERQSTRGFAIGMVFFDLAGGVFCILQQLICCKYDPAMGTVRSEWTWIPISGNKPKLFLATSSICYDLVLMYQHFVMYAGAEPKIQATPETASASGEAKPLLAKTEGPACVTCGQATHHYAPGAFTCHFCGQRPLNLPTQGL